MMDPELGRYVILELSSPGTSFLALVACSGPPTTTGIDPAARQLLFWRQVIRSFSETATDVPAAQLSHALLSSPWYQG